MKRPRSLQPFVFLPVYLLVVLALTQQYLAHRMHLSPWLGGGYGMFSTYDGPGNRQIYVFAQFDGYRREIRIPQHIDPLADKVAAFPAAFMMRSLASQMADLGVVKSLEPEALHVEVWRMHYTNIQLRMAPQPLSKLTLPLAAVRD